MISYRPSAMVANGSIVIVEPLSKIKRGQFQLACSYCFWAHIPFFVFLRHDIRISGRHVYCNDQTECVSCSKEILWWQGIHFGNRGMIMMNLFIRQSVGSYWWSWAKHHYLWREAGGSDANDGWACGSGEKYSVQKWQANIASYLKLTNIS